MRLACFGWALLATHLLACGPQVTFSEHIAPILQAKCQQCHRTGQMAPMSLVTYAEVRPIAKAIQMAIAIGNMPPFYATGPPGYYKDDIRLSDEEKRLIAEWADSGAPEGDPALLPEPVAWDDSEWPFGEPDLVLRFPAHTPESNLKDQWITFFADLEFPEDLWARGFHLKTLSKKAAHHSTLFMVGPDQEIPETHKTEEHIELGTARLFTWFPGLVVDPLPDGQAIKLPKSWRVAARTHFGPQSKRITEEMELGIYFATGKVNRIQRRVGVQFIKEIKLPPGASDYTLRKKKTFHQAGWISHFKVHMHLRGKSSQIILHFPDGTSETVFDLPSYRFSWQRYYYLAKPRLVPKGTVAEFVAVWDNSADNPLNPDPTAWCGWGKKTTDEMYGGAIFYIPKQKLPHPIRVENGRSARART